MSGAHSTQSGQMDANRAPFALISDLDGTLLGDPDALVEFAQWAAARRNVMRLGFATGRFFESVRDAVRDTPLPAPDVVISGVGISIRDFDTGAEWPEWRARLRATGWDRAGLKHFLADDAAPLQPQPEEFQDEFKLSYYWEDASPEELAALLRRAAEAGFQFELIYSSARDLDFLPPGVNKGAAAAMVAERWGIGDGRVVVSGDTGNDASLFRPEFRGVIVANAQPELLSLDGPNIYRATRSYAAGVLEGLRHWL